MNKRLITIVLGIFIAVGVGLFAVQAADHAYFSADKTTVLIGEPVELILHIRVPQDAWIALPDLTNSLSPFKVKSVGDLKLVQQFDDSTIEYNLPLEVVLWRTGTYQIPPFTVSYHVTGSGSVNLPVDPFQLDVTTVLNENDLILRPLKPLENMPYFPIWQVMLPLGVVVGGVVLFSRKRLAQMWKRPSQLDKSATLGHPQAVYALTTLRQIEESNASPLVIYIQVSDCLRTYLFKRYSVQALDMTTLELIEELNSKAIVPDDYRQKLIEMLKRADLVKFARVIPKQPAAQQYIAVANQWIQAVEQTNSERPL